MELNRVWSVSRVLKQMKGPPCPPQLCVEPLACSGHRCKCRECKLTFFTGCPSSKRLREAPATGAKSEGWPPEMLAFPNREENACDGGSALSSFVACMPSPMSDLTE